MKNKTMEGKMKPDKKEKWEKKFDKEFNYWPWEQVNICYISPEKVKSFVRSLLKSQRQELKKKVEGLDNPFKKDWDYPYDQAICEVLTLLEELKE